MSTRTINPYTEQVHREYRVETLEGVRSKIAALGKAQQEWERDINTRLEALREVKKRWASNLTELSELMSSEMGKSISQSEAEVKKCALLLDYVIENSEELLAPEPIKNCVFARLQNNGQSCIASKRFIVHEKVYNDFYKGMKEGFSKIKIGDPLDKTTFLGPLSSREQKETVQEQVKRLRSMGQVEQLATGLKGNFEPPTIVKTDALFDEEVFGPVAVLKKFKTYEEAIRIANETPFGLGASIWGEPEEAEKLVPNIEAGMVFVNKIVVSDPRLPFGGVKKSGIGYELSSYGMLEFTHKRTVWVN
ncbi:MAG TPA: aldehyde dehydrogenase family protein [Candidatus Bathyarchaeia archaeon]|nr:aldehyde dehydrogenase family protein [Candidatus Bathyarchaeia archaeon]